jgi:NAD-dependent deacetylase
MHVALLPASAEAAAQVLARATRIVVVSGAGLSKASGIPTYRDRGGIWETGDNLKFAQVDTYQQDPRAFAEFWGARRNEVRRAQPNPAHRALRHLQLVNHHRLKAMASYDGSSR